jgi:hypothetical protein
LGGSAGWGDGYLGCALGVLYIYPDPS